MSGAVPFGPVHVLIIGILLSVELYFLKRIKRWSFDGYISVPGVFRVLSRTENIAGSMRAGTGCAFTTGSFTRI